MSDRLLRKNEIAAMLGTSPSVAASILKQHDVHPIDIGRGRGKGLRWLESGVQAVILTMHRDAQPKPKKACPHTPGLSMPLHKMSVSAVQSLLAKGHPVQ